MGFGTLKASLPAVALALLCASTAAAQSVDGEIARRVVLIQSASGASERIERAAQLAEYVASRGPLDVAYVEAPVVDDMAELLEDNVDMVRFYAAASLGFLGPAARRAIPALEKALARHEQERGIVFGQPRVFSAAISSAQAICAALMRIDLNRVPATCQSYP
jgi:hypothetical protein